MNNCPYRVTICSPIYGVEKYIERCAVSLFEQTYSDIDYIFVNDCTKDKSIELLQEVIERYPDRKNDIRIIDHDRNRGLSAARNTGVDNVKTDFLIWVDSDDYVSPLMVESLVKTQERTKADIVCSGVQSIFKDYVIDEKRDVNMSESDYLHRLLSKRTEHWIWGKLIRTNLYRLNNIRNIEGTNMAEDYQTLPLLVFHSKNVCFETTPLYFYNRCVESSLTNVISESKQRQAMDSLLYVLGVFSETSFQRDVQAYILILFFEQMKPYIKGHEISKAHTEYYKCVLNNIPWRVYTTLKIKDLLGVLYSRIFILNKKRSNEAE